MTASCSACARSARAGTSRYARRRWGLRPAALGGEPSGAGRARARAGPFADEGGDFSNYTYAKYGRVVLEQPGMFAWQIFDAKIIPMLRDEYRIKQVTKVRADTLEAFVKKLEGVDARRCP